MALDLDALRRIHDTMQEPHAWSIHGICGLYAEIVGNDFAAQNLMNYFPEWEGWSGDLNYPVPDPSGMIGPCYLYLGASPEFLWDRENSLYAQKRWELLDWLIERAKQENA